MQYKLPSKSVAMAFDVTNTFLLAIVWDEHVELFRASHKWSLYPNICAYTNDIGYIIEKSSMYHNIIRTRIQVDWIEIVLNFPFKIIKFGKEYLPLYRNQLNTNRW